jgi:hypothetical protein
MMIPNTAQQTATSSRIWETARATASRLPLPYVSFNNPRYPVLAWNASNSVNRSPRFRTIKDHWILSRTEEKVAASRISVTPDRTLKLRTGLLIDVVK